MFKRPSIDIYLSEIMKHGTCPWLLGCRCGLMFMLATRGRCWGYWG